MAPVGSYLCSKRCFLMQFYFGSKNRGGYACKNARNI